MTTPILSVVMSVFNEETTVEHVIERVFSEVRVECELIAVNDGSTDRSGEILDGLAAADKRIQVVHQKNAGKTAALKRGFELTRGEIVVVQDADLETIRRKSVTLFDPSSTATPSR